MDADTFDDWVKRLTPTEGDRLAEHPSAPGSRRALLRLVTALPLTGLLVSLLTEAGEAGGRQKRRKHRNTRQSGDEKRNRKGQAQGQAKGKKKGKAKPERPAPAPGCTPTTCAAQGKNCGPISDGCGATLDCTPACCETQTCESECRADGCSQGEACGGGGTANVCGCVAFGMVTDDENRGACCDSSCCGEDLNGQPLPDGQCMCSTGCG